MTDEEYQELLKGTTNPSTEKSSPLPPKTIIIAAGIAIIIASGIGLTALRAGSQKTVPQPPKSSNATSSVTPTGNTVTVQGKIVCLVNQSDNETCTIAVRTDSDVYILENLTEEDVKRGTFAVGKVVKLEGIVAVPTRSTKQKTKQNISQLFVTSTKETTSTSNGSSTTQPNISPTKVFVQGKLNTPTPQPPTPTHEPGNVGTIVENQEQLNGQVIEVRGYLVHATVGQEACTYLGLCDYSTFVVADTTSLNRDTEKDVTVIANKNEKEENYVNGDWLEFQARVVSNNGIVTLEKVY
jgi:hypothetical protein